MTIKTLLAMAILTLAFSFGCEREAEIETSPPATQPTAGDRVATGVERTGEAIEKAGDKVEDFATKAADRTGEAVDRADEAIRQGADKVGDVIGAARDKIDEKVDVNINASDDASGIRAMIADVTEAAVTPNGLNDVVERFSEADRNRIGRAADADFPQLNAAADQFNLRWKETYEDEFDINDAQATFSHVQINTDGAKGTITFPARAGMPAVTVPVVRENTNWRLDVPDTVTAASLRDSLLSGIKPIAMNQPPLPHDMMEAYRSSAQGVFAALVGERRQ